VVENVRPEIDAGCFLIKRTVGEKVEVTADIHADGHDLLSARVVYRPASRTEWRSAPLKPRENDVWSGEFEIAAEKRHRYTIQA